MRVLVTAPTGNVGRHVVRVLLAAGVAPRLLVRAPDRLDPAVRAACDVRVGDLTDPDAVHAAAAGVDAAFWLDTTPHTAEDPVADSARLGAVFAGAGVPHAVLVSSVGADLGTGAGHIDGLAAIEAALTGGVTVLRCGYFMSNLLLPGAGPVDGVLTGTRDPDEPLAWVAPRDIGEVAAAHLLRPARARVVQGVYGPGDLTSREAAGVLADVLGTPVEYRRITDDALRAALAGLPPAAVEGIVGMTAGTRGRPPVPARDARATTPTTLGEWAWAHRARLAG